MVYILIAKLNVPNINTDWNINAPDIIIIIIMLCSLVFINYLFLVLLCFSKLRVNAIYLQSIIKIYLLYTITIFNLLASFIFINYYECIEIYIITIVNIRSNTLSNFIVLTVLLVSSCVILNSIDYLSIIDSYLFLVYILIFQFTMIIFILTHDFILSFLYWDILGIISYLLINFWSSTINCGIKALIYNKIGDCSFILILSLSYSYLTFINYYPFLSFSLIFNLFYSYIFSYSQSYIMIQLILIIISFTKSAQLPFSSWLLNAMSAPTPISALLHSSTMVIAGVIIGLIINDIIIEVMDSFSLFFLLLILILLLTLLWSLLKAISISDIKSIIAYSTISQISYMFIALLINPFLTLYHIIIHALFK